MISIVYILSIALLSSASVATIRMLRRTLTDLDRECDELAKENRILWERLDAAEAKLNGGES